MSVSIFTINIKARKITFYWLLEIGRWKQEEKQGNCKIFLNEEINTIKFKNRSWSFYKEKSFIKSWLANFKLKLHVDFIARFTPCKLIFILVNGHPSEIVKSLIPSFNSLVFFEVSDKSYHQVIHWIHLIQNSPYGSNFLDTKVIFKQCCCTYFKF